MRHENSSRLALRTYVYQSIYQSKKALTESYVHFLTLERVQLLFEKNEKY